ncbi:MAG: sigma-70 family RNA polymerase sigma factor [Prevotella sp.]|nr:sigma-70 family RNA polymerase sigma factor [Prevotella sp.]
MRKFVLMLTAAMFVLTTSLYATEKSEKKLSVKPFSVINIVGSLKVVYEQGSTYEVSLVGDAAAFDRIRVGSNGSDLNISKYGKVIGNVYVETSDSSDKRSVVVHVKAPDVSVFNMSGSGQIVVGKMKSTAVTFNQAGSGKIAVSQVVASHANFNNAGSGTILVDDVKADYVGLTMAGSGTINCRTSKAANLNCTLTGSGRISVLGEAGNYKKYVLGSGKINDSMLKYDKLLNMGSNVNVTGNTYVIARNVAIDMLRRRRPTSISGDEAHTSWLLQQESDNDTPESQLEWKEDEQWLRQRIEQLPPREMQVMRLRQTERRTNEQIAAILGISKDSVATMLSSARRKLFNQIKERNRT